MASRGYNCGHLRLFLPVHNLALMKLALPSALEAWGKFIAPGTPVSTGRSR
jgi:hypothetical protein